MTDFVFSDADMDLIARALNARADTYARVASKAGTVPDYEIASRAARRHRALAKRVRAAHTTPRTAPHPAARIAAQAARCGTAEFFVEGAPDSDGQHG